MKTIESLPQSRFPAVGQESLIAVQGAIRTALAEHGKAGRPVVVWRDGKVLEVMIDANGDEIVGA